MFTLNAGLRRVIYVLSFEALAILFSTILLSWFSHGEGTDDLVLATAISGIAMVWNLIFNTGFETMERRLGIMERTIPVRVLHSVGFEGGLVLATVPLMMAWYKVGVLEALMMEAAILIFFLIYTFLFTWGFDRIFPLPHQVKPQT